MNQNIIVDTMKLIMQEVIRRDYHASNNCYDLIREIIKIINNLKDIQRIWYRNGNEDVQEIKKIEELLNKLKYEEKKLCIKIPVLDNFINESFDILQQEWMSAWFKGAGLIVLQERVFCDDSLINLVNANVINRIYLRIKAVVSGLRFIAE